MKIKFSHRYSKLLNNLEYITMATLLDVVKLNIEGMSKEFLDYDTDSGCFQLPKKGEFMMLIFKKYGTNHLFTTLRRHTPDKYIYYHGAIGKVFDVEFIENVEKTT